MPEKRIPMRRCIGCMQSYPKQELIRLTYDGTDLLIDRDGRAKGRGVYLCRNAECIGKARKTKAFNRNYKTNINIDITNKVLDEALELVKEVMDDKEDI